MTVTTGRRYGILVVALAATAFNLLFEYSLRGVVSLAENPLLPFLLVNQYLTYFLLLEDLIRRYRMRDGHAMATTAILAVVYQALVSAAAFRGQTLVLGVRWGELLFVVFVWWLVYQTVLTFYAATRLFPRNWDGPLLPGWLRLGLLALNLAGVAVFVLLPGPKGTPVGYAVMAALLVVALVVWLAVLPRPAGRLAVPDMTPVRVFDVLAVVSVLVMVATALAPGPRLDLGGWAVNAAMVPVIRGWTLLVALVYAGYRVVVRRAVPV